MFILSRVTRARYVAGMRGRVRVRGKIAEFLLRKALNSAACVVFNARHLQKDAILRFKVAAEKTLVIRNMVKPRAYVEKPYTQTTSAVVLSNFIKYKGHDVLLEALQVSKTKPKVILVGQGVEEEHIRSEIAVLGLNDSVIISTHQEFEKILENVQFAIHPSETEGFSNAILEEMSYGLPVIAFAIEGNLELIKNNINGLLVPPGNVQAFSEAIDSVSDQVELRTRLSIGAKATADEYSAQKLFENLEEVYLRTWIKKYNNLQSYQDGSSDKVEK
jgi:glycosyltransferase involved in cell wall biosynthesis